MKYDFLEIEKKWQKYWKENHSYKVIEDKNKEKCYILDMFPYPSGSGLHVGHPLGYIATDIYARYKTLNGFNVLHPMGYDSFGLPAEQYAIQTGTHPRITTEKNINRYRQQLDSIGFSYDWSREIATSQSSYYKWTQWIFKLLFNSYYCKTENKAKSIGNLVSIFKKEGNKTVNAYTNENVKFFNAEEWNSMPEKQQYELLLKYRLAFISETWVNWCEELGTVLANDEVKDGYSERGGYPVEQKLMKQWSLAITAYADRLLQDLNNLDWPDSIKEIQKNWIGKSNGVLLNFKTEEHERYIEVFTTRPDTVFGVTFLVLAPEHRLVSDLTIPEQKDKVNQYIRKSKAKSERARQSYKQVSGVFTGSYALHPFTKEKLPIWIADYVLINYGTGAIMAVPCGDQRDWQFAKSFDINIVNIFEGVDIKDSANEQKDNCLKNSDFLNSLTYKEAFSIASKEIESKGIGKVKTNFRLRDAIFSRQRYWGEPFPVYYESGLPYIIENEEVVTLPEIDQYLPTKEGEPPLARAKKEDWNIFKGDRMEVNVMPGWAGSSWYYLRYMDANNDLEFCSKDKSNYWGQVDLYIGGSEHAVGHLLYSRFWTKFLYDKGFVSFNEPFKKLVNQGMILGRSSLVYRINNTNTFVTAEKKSEHDVTAIHVDVSLVTNNILDISLFKKWRPEFEGAEFILNDQNNYLCDYEVEKMSKSKFNVVVPDDLIQKFGADTFRLYEMFLGPLEQYKPWDTSGINGVHNFLKKFWRLTHDEKNNFLISEEEPSKDSYKTLHKTIKKVKEDIDRLSFNTPVSALMICVNELTDQKCNSRKIISEFTLLLSPYAPHLAEEIWSKLGNKTSITKASFPIFNQNYLEESEFTYPVSFNGKMRFKATFGIDKKQKEIEKEILENENTIKYLSGKKPNKIIVVHKRIINIVF